MMFPDNGSVQIYRSDDAMVDFGIPRPVFRERFLQSEK